MAEVVSREQKKVEEFITSLLSGLENDSSLPVIVIPRREDEKELLCENDHDHDRRADSTEEEDIEIDVDSEDAGEDITETRAEMICTPKLQPPVAAVLLPILMPPMGATSRPTVCRI